MLSQYEERVRDGALFIARPDPDDANFHIMTIRLPSGPMAMYETADGFEAQLAFARLCFAIVSSMVGIWLKPRALSWIARRCIGMAYELFLRDAEDRDNRLYVRHRRIS